MSCFERMLCTLPGHCKTNSEFRTFSDRKLFKWKDLLRDYLNRVGNFPTWQSRVESCRVRAPGPAVYAPALLVQAGSWLQLALLSLPPPLPLPDGQIRERRARRHMEPRGHRDVSWVWGRLRLDKPPGRLL